MEATTHKHSAKDKIKLERHYINRNPTPSNLPFLLCSRSSLEK